MARRDRERDPASIGELLPTLVAGRGWVERMALGRLRDGWTELVGAQVAARSEAVKLERGVLHVRAEGGVWAAELTLLSATLASKADAFLGGGKVREVRVNSSGGTATERGDRGLKRR